ncbi:hypothetical protein NO2_0567 [Candidatus Termititenax persephonae]|uniref:Uncharacterized protein n=1 Tax=Candidatus Termititenax persephonae TaxID=2218525 RepID=A0A388TGD8_9BACT|nr:hypothetical protein NO2_0567 [Candidatus Termititenax persephonae]
MYRYLLKVIAERHAPPSLNEIVNADAPQQNVPKMVAFDRRQALDAELERAKNIDLQFFAEDSPLTGEEIAERLDVKKNDIQVREYENSPLALVTPSKGGELNIRIAPQQKVTVSRPFLVNKQTGQPVGPLRLVEKIVLEIAGRKIETGSIRVTLDGNLPSVSDSAQAAADMPKIAHIIRGTNRSLNLNGQKAGASMEKLNILNSEDTGYIIYDNNKEPLWVAIRNNLNSPQNPQEKFKIYEAKTVNDQAYPTLVREITDGSVRIEIEGNIKGDFERVSADKQALEQALGQKDAPPQINIEPYVSQTDKLLKMLGTDGRDIVPKWSMPVKVLDKGSIVNALLLDFNYAGRGIIVIDTYGRQSPIAALPVRAGQSDAVSYRFVDVEILKNGYINLGKEIIGKDNAARIDLARRMLAKAVEIAARQGGQTALPPKLAEMAVAQAGTKIGQSQPQDGGAGTAATVKTPATAETIAATQGAKISVPADANALLKGQDAIPSTPRAENEQTEKQNQQDEQPEQGRQEDSAEKDNEFAGEPGLGLTQQQPLDPRNVPGIDSKQGSEITLRLPDGQVIQGNCRAMEDGRRLLIVNKNDTPLYIAVPINSANGKLKGYKFFEVNIDAKNGVQQGKEIDNLIMYNKDLSKIVIINDKVAKNKTPLKKFHDRHKDSLHSDIDITRSNLGWLKTFEDLERAREQFAINDDVRETQLKHWSGPLNFFRRCGENIKWYRDLLTHYPHVGLTLVTQTILLSALPILSFASIAAAGIGLAVFLQAAPIIIGGIVCTFFFGAIFSFGKSMHIYTKTMFETDKSKGEENTWQTTLSGKAAEIFLQAMNDKNPNNINKDKWARFEKSEENSGILLERGKDGHSLTLKFNTSVSLEDSTTWLHLMQEDILPKAEKIFADTDKWRDKTKERSLRKSLKADRIAAGQLAGLDYWSRQRNAHTYAGRNDRNRTVRWQLCLTDLADKHHLEGLEKYALPAELENLAGVFVDTKIIKIGQHEEEFKFLQVNYRLTKAQLDDIIQSLRSGWEKGLIKGDKAALEQVITKIKIAYKIVQKGFDAEMKEAEEENRKVAINERANQIDATHTTYTSAPVYVVLNMLYTAAKQDGTNLRFMASNINNGPQALFDAQSRGMYVMARTVEARANALKAVLKEKEVWPGNPFASLLDMGDPLRSAEENELFVLLSDTYGEEVWNNLKLSDVMFKVCPALGEEHAVLQASLSRFLLHNNVSLDQQLYVDIKKMGGLSGSKYNGKRLRISGAQEDKDEVNLEELLIDDIINNEGSLIVSEELIHNFCVQLQYYIKTNIEQPKQIRDLVRKYYSSNLKQAGQGKLAELLATRFAFQGDAAQDGNHIDGFAKALDLVKNMCVHREPIYDKAQEYLRAQLKQNMLNNTNAIGELTDEEWLKTMGYAYYLTHQELRAKETAPYIGQDMHGRLDLTDDVKEEYRKWFAKRLQKVLTVSDGQDFVADILAGREVEYLKYDKPTLEKAFKLNKELDKQYEQPLVEWLVKYMSATEETRQTDLLKLQTDLNKLKESLAEKEYEETQKTAELKEEYEEIQKKEKQETTKLEQKIKEIENNISVRESEILEGTRSKLLADLFKTIHQVKVGENLRSATLAKDMCQKMFDDSMADNGNYTLGGGLQEAFRRKIEMFFRIEWCRHQQRRKRSNDVQVIQVPVNKLFKGVVEESIELDKNKDKNILALLQENKYKNKIIYNEAQKKLIFKFDAGNDGDLFVRLIKEAQLTYGEQTKLYNIFVKYNFYDTNAFRNVRVQEKLDDNTSLSTKTIDELLPKYKKAVQYNNSTRTLSFQTGSLDFFKLLNDSRLAPADEELLRSLWAKHNELGHLDKKTRDAEQEILLKTYAFTEAAQTIMENYRFDIKRLLVKIKVKYNNKDFRHLTPQDRFSAVLDEEHAEMRAELRRAFVEIYQNNKGSIQNLSEWAELAENSADAKNAADVKNAAALADLLTGVVEEGDLAAQTTAWGLLQQTNAVLIDAAKLHGKTALAYEDSKDMDLVAQARMERDKILKQREQSELFVRDAQDDLVAVKNPSSKVLMRKLLRDYLKSFEDKKGTAAGGGAFVQIAYSEIAPRLSQALLDALDYLHNKKGNLTLNIFKFADFSQVSNGEEGKSIFDGKSEAVVASFDKKLGNILPLLVEIAKSKFTKDNKLIALDRIDDIDGMWELAGLNNNKSRADLLKQIGWPTNKGWPEFKGREHKDLSGSEMRLLNALSAKYLEKLLKEFLGLGDDEWRELNTGNKKGNKKGDKEKVDQIRKKALQNLTKELDNIVALLEEESYLRTDLELIFVGWGMARDVAEAAAVGLFEDVVLHGEDKKFALPATDDKSKSATNDAKPATDDKSEIYIDPRKWVNDYHKLHNAGHKDALTKESKDKGLSFFTENVLGKYIKSTADKMIDIEKKWQTETLKSTNEPSTMFYMYRICPKIYSTFKPDSINQTMTGSNVFEHIQMTIKLVLQQYKKYHGKRKALDIWHDLQERMGRDSPSAAFADFFYHGTLHCFEPIITKACEAFDDYVAENKGFADNHMNVFAEDFRDKHAEYKLDRKRNMHKKIDRIFHVLMPTVIDSYNREIRSKEFQGAPSEEIEALQKQKATAVRAMNSAHTLNEVMDVVLRTDFDKDNYLTNEYPRSISALWRPDNEGNFANSDYINNIFEQPGAVDPNIDRYVHSAMVNSHNFMNGYAEATSESRRLGAGTQPEGCFNGHNMKDWEYIYYTLSKNCYISSAPDDRQAPFIPRAIEVVVGGILHLLVSGLVFSLTGGNIVATLGANWLTHNIFIPRLNRAIQWGAQKWYVYSRKMYPQFLERHLTLISSESSVEDRKNRDKQWLSLSRFSKHSPGYIGNAPGEPKTSRAAQIKRWFGAIVEGVKANLLNAKWLITHMKDYCLPQAVYDHILNGFQDGEYQDQFPRASLINQRFAFTLVLSLIASVPVLTFASSLPAILLGGAITAIAFNLAASFAQYFFIKQSISHYHYHRDGVTRKIEKDADNTDAMNYGSSSLSRRVLQVLYTINKIVFMTTETPWTYTRENFNQYYHGRIIDRNEALKAELGSQKKVPDNFGRILSGPGSTGQKTLRQLDYLRRLMPKVASIAAVVYPPVLAGMYLTSGFNVFSLLTVLPYLGVTAWAVLGARTQYSRLKKIVNRDSVGTASRRDWYNVPRSRLIMDYQRNRQTQRKVSDAERVVS